MIKRLCIQIIKNLRACPIIMDDRELFAYLIIFDMDEYKNYSRYGL